MKTIFSINPFHMKPAIKKAFRPSREVAIPIELEKDLYDKLAKMQNSLNYMAAHYNLDIVVHNDALAKAAHITCMNKDFECNGHLIHAEDDETNIARKIYEPVSNVLLGYKKYQ